MASNDPGLKALFRLESDLEFLERVAGPQARVAALNKLRITIRSRVTKRIFAESKMLPVVDSKGRKILDPDVQIKTGLKQFHIRDRVRTSKASRFRPYTNASVFIRPIPLRSLHKRVPKKEGGGTKLQGTVVRKTARRKTGGIKIGTTMFPRMFVQYVGKSQGFQIFARKQEKTWKPGTYGWGRPPGTTGKDRMPYDVPKFNLQPIAQKHFEPTVIQVLQERSQLEFDRALVATGAKLLKASSR